MNSAPLLPAALILTLLACAPSYAPPDPHPLSPGTDLSLRIPVGPKDNPATLATWILHPPKNTPIQGTILFLHGFMATHRQLLRQADELRHDGYRCILVDSRGFGASTGQHITFGALDAHDMKQLVDYLQSKNLCTPTLGVYGTSMGAATSILYAALDPRVQAVVAIAPFATIRDEVLPYSRRVLPTFASERLSTAGINTLANAVAALTNLDLDSAKPLDAITHTTAPILLIHGTADTIIPHDASEQLHAAAPTHSSLLLLPNRGHLELCFDFRHELHPVTAPFFNTNLK